ncbi:MAG: hypothetical protein FWD46_08915 [Cystobacterineae bacterium]|nr:hypothetical protein [Cystobacterineae bacterium]
MGSRERKSITNTASKIREWFSKNKDSWIESHRDRVLTRLGKDIFPFIGSKAMGSVTASELLGVLQRNLRTLYFRHIKCMSCLYAHVWQAVFWMHR